MRKIISPIIYILSVPVIVLLSVFTFNIIEVNFGLHTIVWTGDIDMFLVVVCFCLLIFSYLTKFIIKFENSELEVLNDHIRQSSLFYILLIFFLIQNIINSDNIISGGIQDALFALISVILLLGIIINFLVLRKLSRNI